MSLLGTLEQFNLKQVLQRLETHEKSGLLVVKQGEEWLEFYFQKGQLQCTGPLRTQTTLENRLVQAGVISPQARQEALRAYDLAEPNETRMAMLLIDNGYVSREALRAWASKETTKVLQQVLTWHSGDIYFEDEVPPPSGRLRVALSVSILLNSISTPAPQTARPRITTVLVKDESAASSVARAQEASAAPRPLSTTQLLFDESVPAPRTTSALLPELSPSANNNSPDTPAITSTLTPPRPVSKLSPLRQIDTSFMKPEMVLMLNDLSSLRQQNPQFQLTPDQWRLFTLIDGRISLQTACQKLDTTPQWICQVAGELIALGLAYLLPPGDVVQRPAPVANQPVTTGLTNGHAIPAYAAQSPSGFVPMPTTDALLYPSAVPAGQGYYSQPTPITQSARQAAVRGYYSQPMQAAPSGRQPAVNRGYAQAGRGR